LSLLLPILLFWWFTIDAPFWLALALATLILGTLAGMEVPILTRLLEKDEGLRGAVSSILALDYCGALVGSLAFPVLLLPFLGMFPTAAIIASFPAFMVVAIGQVFPKNRFWQRLGLLIGVALCAIAPWVTQIGDRLENSLYKAPIVHRIQTPYQRIVLTRQGSDTRLFLDGDLQLSTLDEYRYHEALVHPAMSAVIAQTNDRPLKILLLGAGDGMALREILKWPQVSQVLLIDLDTAVINLAQHDPALVNANHNAFAEPRVQVKTGDAFKLVPQLRENFDLIIADFPDPDKDVIAKLYSQGFYQQVRDRLTNNGIFITQASSPFFAPQVFSCITKTLASIGWRTYPYLTEVPSFGLWGFVMASHDPIIPANLKLPIPTRFLTEAMLASLFNLPRDITIDPQVEINRLSQPIIVKYQENPRWRAYH
jgi:spermidine synthase